MVSDFDSDLSGASLLVLGFAALLVALRAVFPPTAEQLRTADPLIQLVQANAGLWLVPVLCAIPALSWCAWRRPDRAALRCAARGLGLGFGAALIAVTALRFVFGATLPPFFPPEESARPGLVLGFGAGILEEAAIRLGVAAPIFVLLRRSWSARAAAGTAIIVSGLVFALAHELGPAAAIFEPRHLATRFLLPGCGLSILFFKPGPSFCVASHATAHFGIAFLFTGAPSP